MRAFSIQSLVDLIAAASVSPTASHRSPSLAYLYRRTLADGRRSGRNATFDDLGALVEATSESVPGIETMEDYLPLDARSGPVVRWADEVYRVLPGALERPIAMVGQHALLAYVIDPVLDRELGFGLGDVGELILRHLDHITEQLLPVWPTTTGQIGMQAFVSEAEVQAIASCRSLSETASQCERPESAVRALSAFTINHARLPIDIWDPIATFRSSIAVRRKGEVFDLPAGMLMEAIPSIGADLAARATQLDDRLDEIYWGTVGNRIGTLFTGAAQSITGPIRIANSSRSPIHSLITYNERQVVALDVAAGLTPEAIQTRLDAGARSLAKIRPGAEVRNPEQTWRIPDDAEVVRLQIISGPQLRTGLGLMGVAVRLEDLEWICYSSQRSRDDLWYFVRDLAGTPGARSATAWDLIDKWEVWKDGKTFYRGGQPVDQLVFPPHAAIAEWDEAARAAPSEVALCALDLPSLRDWPVVSLESRRGTEIGDMNQEPVWHLVCWPVPVAIAKTDALAPSEQFETLWNLAVGLAWKLDYCQAEFVDGATRRGLRSLRITFSFAERTHGPVLTASQVANDELKIEWDDRLQMSLAQDSFAVETSLGELVAMTLAPECKADFSAAWEAAPPGVRMDGFEIQQQAKSLAEPTEAKEAVRADELRHLGRFLIEEGVEPGELGGETASRFESQVVFPWLLNRFHQSIADLDAADLLQYALTQLERSHHQRAKIDRQLGWQQGFPVKGDDDDQGLSGREANSRLTRSVALAMEEILARPPSGTRSTDVLAWQRLLSIADLCIESCMRSDSLYRELTTTTTEITTYYEVNVHYSDSPTDVDMAAYGLARTRSTMPEPVPISLGRAASAPDDEPDPRPVVDSMPELRGIDLAMKATMGFGVDATTGLINIARQWDASPDMPARCVLADQIVEECVGWTVGADRDQFVRALDWMTLRGEDLAVEKIPHWETEKRHKRVLTRPFVADGERVWVLPWTAESTMRVLVAYLGDGRLPWPQRWLPDEVAQALLTHRQGRNRQLERECLEGLQTAGLIVRGSVKPHKCKTVGLTSLSGEIDVLCLDERRGRIWVIEVKDPYTPYSSRQIRRLIDDFEGAAGYVAKLMKKVADVTRDADAVGSALGGRAQHTNWEVGGIMVTRHVEPAAFVVHPEVAFCSVDRAPKVVNCDDIPDLGWNP